MLVGGPRVREMSDQLTGKLVNVDASQIVELLSLEVEDCRATDNRDTSATAVEDVSVHHFPFAFSPRPRGDRVFALALGRLARSVLELWQSTPRYLLPLPRPPHPSRPP